MTDWLDSEEFELLVIKLQDCPDLYDFSGIDEFRTKIREHFEPKRKWIKITDDPATWPPNHAFVLCSFADTMPLVCIYYQEPFKAFYSTGKTVYPSSWMPLPEPWGEE